MNDSVSGFFWYDVRQRVSPTVVSDGLDEVVLDGVTVSEIRKQFHFCLGVPSQHQRRLFFCQPQSYQKS